MFDYNYDETELSVTYKDKTIKLNPALVMKQGLDLFNIGVLLELHVEKLKYMEKMEATDDVTELKNLADAIEYVEFEMQAHWGYPKDVRYHEWYNIPKCTCPSMDNKDRRGTDYCIISSDCPIHGSGDLSKGFKEGYITPVDQKPPPKPALTKLSCILEDYDEVEMLRGLFDEEQLGELRYGPEGEDENKLKVVVSIVKEQNV